MLLLTDAWEGSVVLRVWNCILIHNHWVNVVALQFRTDFIQTQQEWYLPSSRNFSDPWISFEPSFKKQISSSLRTEKGKILQIDFCTLYCPTKIRRNCDIFYQSSSSCSSIDVYECIYSFVYLLHLYKKQLCDICISSRAAQTSIVDHPCAIIASTHQNNA